MFCIYRITNLLNNKTYIGQHQYNADQEDPLDNYDGSGKLLNISYKKYGKENFKKEVIVKGVNSKSEIDILEKQYILEEKLSGRGEYNIASGGEGGDTLSNNPNLFEIGKKISLSHLGEKNNFYGKHHSKESIQKAKETKRKNNTWPSGKNNGMYGKKHSEETKRKMSAKKLGGKLSEETKDLLRQLNTGKIMSEESKQKIRESKLGKVRPEYVKDKIRKTKEKSKEKRISFMKVRRDMYFEMKNTGAFEGTWNEFQRWIKDQPQPHLQSME